MGGTQHAVGARRMTRHLSRATGLGGQRVHRARIRNEPPAPLSRLPILRSSSPVNGTTTFDDSVEDGVENLGSCLDDSAAGCDHNPNFGDRPVPSATTHFAIFGYSQSAVVASLVKDAADRWRYPDNQPGRHRVLFDLESHAAQRRHPGPGLRGLHHPAHRHHVLWADEEQLPDFGPVQPREETDIVAPHSRRRAAIRLPRWRRSDAATEHPRDDELDHGVCAVARSRAEPHPGRGRSHRPGAVRRHALLHDPRRHASHPAAARDGRCARTGAGAARRHPAGVDRRRLRPREQSR